MNRIWLIRHGESESNANKKTTHPAASNLTEQGRAQAACLPRAFDGAPDLFVTSSYARTGQTAEPVLAAFPDVAHEVWPVHEYTVLAPEHYDGTTHAYRKPLVEAYWEKADPAYSDLGKGESFCAYMERVRGAIERMRAATGFVAIFSHGQFTRAVLWQLLTNRLDAAPTAELMAEYRRFVLGVALPNCAILPLAFQGDEVCISPFLTAHLSADLITACGAH